MLEWTTDYATGVPKLDAQHKVLFDCINQVEALLATPVIDFADARRLLDFLEKFAASHFHAEETCMKRFRCPAHEQNKEAHAQFMHVLKFCHDEYVDAAAPREVLERLHASLVWWLDNHIRQIDTQLKPCAGQPSLGAEPTPSRPDATG